MEDAMILNRGSVERGFMHARVLATKTIDLAEKTKGRACTLYFGRPCLASPSWHPCLSAPLPCSALNCPIDNLCLTPAGPQPSPSNTLCAVQVSLLET